MISKPGWTLWFVWFAIYTASYMLFEVLLHGKAAWGSLAGTIESGIVSTTITWLFVYRRWSKSDSLY